MTAPNEVVIRHACADLAGRDGILAKAYSRVGDPVWRNAPASFETLARAVTYQLVSLNAAGAIWARTQARVGPEFSAEAVLAIPDDDLRACGLSRPKIGHLRAIAEAFVSGHLDPDNLRAASPAQARARLLGVRGIGPWTADLFLLTALGHLDAFPHGDVGIMEAYRLASGDPARLSARDFAVKAELWRPYRGVAAHLLWTFLHAHRAAARA